MAKPSVESKGIETIRKKYGESAIIRLGENHYEKVDVVPTGSLALDYALGVGGIPLGRITEIFGPEGTGKTTICQHIVGNAQRANLQVAYVDMEHAIDPNYATTCGVDWESAYISQPDTGEQALNIVEVLVNSGGQWVIIVDSVAALVPQAEIEGDMGASHMGLQARLMSQAMRKLSGITKKSNSAIIFSNQIRMKIGVVFGNPETTTGGNALKFYSTVRMDVRKIETIKGKEDPIGNKVKVRVVKNKVAPPFREAVFNIIYGQGISRESELLDIGSKWDIVTKRGAHYYYGDDKIGQGEQNSVLFLKEHSGMASEIEGKIRARFPTSTLPDVAHVSDPQEEDEAEL